jgi:hypothetical protein
MVASATVSGIFTAGLLVDIAVAYTREGTAVLPGLLQEREERTTERALK